MKKLSKILIVILIFTLTIGFSNNIAIAEEDSMAVFYEPWKQYQESARTGDANLLRTIVETMIYATEWKDIPAESKTSYINFLSQLASNSILSSLENETWLAAIKSRIETIKKSNLTDEQKAATSGVKKQVDEMQKIVNKAYEEQYGSGEDYKIYKNPDKDEEEELNREIDTSVDAIDEAVEGADEFIEEGSNNQINEEKLQDTFSYIYNILLGIGIGISVVVAIILAIKFMIAGIDEKAEVKKMFFVYVIACIIIFGGFGIWKIVVNVMGDASTTSEVTEIEENEQNGENNENLGEDGLQSRDDGKEETMLANFIRLNYTNLKVNMNRVHQLKLDAVAVAKKIELAAEKILWMSSNENVASVNDRGLVTFKDDGTVTITATLASNPAITKTCTIQVVKTVMKSIKITPPNYDKPIVMLDKAHYNFTILDTQAEPKNAKVTYTSSNKKVATVNSKGKIVAKGYGTATITATGSINGTSKSAKCEVRVIAKATEKTKDSGAFRETNHTPNSTLYIRNYSTSKKRIDPDKSGSWSTEEVESYINNGEWILREYGKARESKYYEYKAGTYYYFGSPYHAYSANKKAGDISPTDWILLFTSKNQWVYILHRQSDGKWKQEVAMQASGGYYWGPRYDAYLGSREADFGGIAFAIYYNQQEGVNKYRIL